MYTHSFSFNIPNYIPGFVVYTHSFSFNIPNCIRSRVSCVHSQLLIYPCCAAIYVQSAECTFRAVERGDKTLPGPRLKMAPGIVLHTPPPPPPLKVQSLRIKLLGGLMPPIIFKGGPLLALGRPLRQAILPYFNSEFSKMTSFSENNMVNTVK